MENFKVGDVVVATRDGSKYYNKGDRGKVISVGVKDCFVDFNNMGNSGVVENGLWHIDFDHMKLYKDAPMQEIDPKDVPQMMRDGQLVSGETVLEFSRNFADAYPEVFDRIFIGVFPYDKDELYFAAFDKELEALCHYPHARFPRPDLRDGDPVIVGDGDHVVFRSYGEGNVICYYAYGKNRWTWTHVMPGVTDKWSIPTPDELEAGGYPRDYYTSRGM